MKPMQPAHYRKFFFILIVLGTLAGTSFGGGHGDSGQKIQRLEMLCKVWGFLKYYHPHAGSGRLDWDSVLVTTLPNILESETQESFQAALVELWQTAGSNLTMSPVDRSDSLLTYSTWDWIESVEDTTLRRNLRSLQHAGNGGALNTYANDRLPSGRRIGFVRYFERSYEDMSLPDTRYRLLALFRIWNIIQYFFPYRDLMDENWNAVLVKFIPRFIDASDTLSYHLAVKSLMTQLNDGHAFAFSRVLASHFGSLVAPYVVWYVEGQYVIQEVLNDSLDAESDIRRGDVLVELHGRPIRDRVDYLAQYFGGSNVASIKGKEIAARLLASNDSVSTVTVLRRGQKMKLPIRFYPRSREFAGKSEENPIWKLFDSRIGYVDIGKLTNPDTVSYLFADMKGTNAIILDFRKYPAFQVLYRFLSSVQSENKPFARFVSPVTEFPGYWREHYDGFLFEKPVEVPFKGRLILLVNEFSGSLGEFFPMALQVLPNTLTIGSQTWGADGNQVGLALPGGIRIGFSGLGVYYPDGTVCQRKGIRIDLEVRPTISGVGEGRDELLEKALDIAREEL